MEESGMDPNEVIAEAERILKGGFSPRVPIEPDREDIEAVEKDLGPVRNLDDDKELGDRWRLAQAHKLIRLYRQKKAS